MDDTKAFKNATISIYNLLKRFPTQNGEMNQV